MVDDLGAVLVIAIFYTQTINFIDLMIGDFFLVVIVAANFPGVCKTSFNATVAFLGVWLAFLFSGVHATIAGVHIDGNIMELLLNPTSLGIIVGLTLGKPSASRFYRKAWSG